MTLSLHRTCPLAITVAKPGVSRAFAFLVELGVGHSSSAIDPDSGMLLNLVEVDEVLGKLQLYWAQREVSSLPQLTQESLLFTQQALQQNGEFHVSRLCFREQRGWFVGWEQEGICGREFFQETPAGLIQFEVTKKWDLGSDGIAISRQQPNPASTLSSNFMQTFTGELPEELSTLLSAESLQAIIAEGLENGQAFQADPSLRQVRNTLFPRQTFSSAAPARVQSVFTK